MSRYSKNKVRTPNPFGPVDEKAVAAFEQMIGSPLPTGYRIYLLEFNGAKFENDYFKKEGGIDGQADSFFGLHEGPDYARLDVRWKLSGCYDIGELAPGVNDYIVFAGTGTGDLLLLSLITGEVCFLDHESIEDDPEVGARFNAIPIAANFDEFVEGLMPARMIPD